MGFLARRRVVSLVPSVTETLLAWGVTPVAVTRFCEQPSLPSVGGTKDPDVERIVAMRPDLVVMCDEENRIEDHDALRAAGLRVISLKVESVADSAAGLARLAEVLELPRGLAGTIAPPDLGAESVLRAFVPIWRRPWMGLGTATYGSDLLRHLGVEVVAPDSGDRYPTLTLGDVAGLGADVVLAPSEPYPFARRHVAELSAIAPVTLVDGQDLFWWGARTAAALERLAGVVTALQPAAPGGDVELVDDPGPELIDGCAEVWLEAELARVPTPPYPTYHTDQASGVRSTLSRSDAWCTVARGRAGEVAGFVAGFADPAARPGTSWLAYLAVRRDRRRHGLGAALVRHALDRAHDRGELRMLLTVHQSNLAARSLYEALGWLPTGTAESTPLDDELLVEYRHDL